MKRVIVKCKLKSRDDFEQKLSEINLDFSPVYWQHDRIYIPRNYKKNSNYPRLVVRTEMKSVDRPANYYFILKRHIEDSGVDIVEKTQVKDYENTVNMVLQLGFEPASEISRRRQEIKMDENNLIYLDKVDNLPGYYAKIESNLVPEDSVFEARQDLERTFLTLGESDFINIPYSEL